ncbi:MAG TPA: class I SAM-dependent methyltransferase [Myxococcota bacterium]|jgi:SAM-dependent methyltransferase|nr:class I SAM-dependent methyltransferase [Myxococcota bacterium]
MQDDIRPSLRGRFNAWFLARLDDFMHEAFGERKRRLLAALPSSLVELGPGAGANFRYYPAGTRVVAVEPNPAMHAPLRAAAERRGLALEIHGIRGESIDLPDACTDLVVSTLVLCSVDDPGQVVREAYRLLRPGGRLVFLEHVAAPSGTALRGLQALVRAPWRWLFEGCTTDRETWRTLETAGFSRLELEHFRLRGAFPHVSPQIAGSATK